MPPPSEARVVVPRGVLHRKARKVQCYRCATVLTCHNRWRIGGSLLNQFCMCINALDLPSDSENHKCANSALVLRF